ncbi:MAG: transporter [Robiginitomaculum sp.]|nr:MAG: transporter [Robiginitomaculum sp.]
MVIVNFNVVMTVQVDGDIAQGFASLLQGRAAALFVILAGIGLGIGAMRSEWGDMRRGTLKRALFLLIVGILNTIIFEADIIHYYAFYFLFGVWFLRASNKVIWLGIAGCIIGFFCLIFTLNFDQGWNWSDYSYVDFWTPTGFLRNLFFNGWHPIFPWLAFLLFGIWLSRLDLRAKKLHIKLICFGGVSFIAITLLSHYLVAISGDTELTALLGTAPIPATPFYLIAGASFAMVIIGACFLCESILRKLKILPLFTCAGRQTLTLYIAHIYIGMGVLEGLGLMGGQSGILALLASGAFCVIASVYAFVWTKYFKRGPLEMLMRKLT